MTKYQLNHSVFSFSIAWICAQLLTLTSNAQSLNDVKNPVKYPVIYCTDLFHPHEDPDDHFDLATLMAIPQLDVKGIILDQGDRQLRQPGAIPISQASYLTGKKIEHAPGLGAKLTSPEDTGNSRPATEQQGVKMILEILKSSKEPVTIITVGSVRDVAAAYNREPDLLKRKVRRILSFIGEASNKAFMEYNVTLDPHAYECLMRSGLPLFWFPCFDGGLWQNRGHASFWQAKHSRILQNAPPQWIQFFIYALEKKTSDPLAFLCQSVEETAKRRLFEGTRNLWCAALFLVAADQTIVFDGNNYIRQPFDWEISNVKRSNQENLFDFEDVSISINEQAVIRYGSLPGAKSIKRFVIRNPQRYPEGLTQVTADLINQLSQGISKHTK